MEIQDTFSRLFKTITQSEAFMLVILVKGVFFIVHITYLTIFFSLWLNEGTHFYTNFVSNIFSYFILCYNISVKLGWVVRLCKMGQKT